MMRLAFAALILLGGCSEPDSVKTYESPVDGLFYTVEEFHASGPVSDTNRVVAHLVRNGQESRMLVMEGDNLVLANVHWNSSSEVTLCLVGGITNMFRNEVTLISGRESVVVRNRLVEACDDELSKPIAK